MRFLRSVLAISAVLAGTVGCSADSPDDVGADEAAAVLVGQFDLSEPQAQCLTELFRDDAAARRAVGTEAEPGDYRALNDAVDRCVDAGSLARSVAGLMARNYSPAGPASATQQTCLEQAIASLPREQQVVLITGPLNQQIDLGSAANLDAGNVVRFLAQQCGLLTTETTG